jgi:hypothetical protein
MKIQEWLDQIINGTTGLHSFEAHECAVMNVPRDEAVASWVIRCLANPASEGSADVLESIIRRREKVGQAQ